MPSSAASATPSPLRRLLAAIPQGSPLILIRRAPPPQNSGEFSAIELSRNHKPSKGVGHTDQRRGLVVQTRLIDANEDVGRDQQPAKGAYFPAEGHAFLIDGGCGHANLGVQTAGEVGNGRGLEYLLFVLQGLAEKIGGNAQIGRASCRERV